MAKAVIQVINDTGEVEEEALIAQGVTTEEAQRIMRDMVDGATPGMA